MPVILGSHCVHWQKSRNPTHVVHYNLFFKLFQDGCCNLETKRESQEEMACIAGKIS